MHHHLLRCRAMPKPLPPPPPRMPGVSAGRVFAPLPPAPPLQSRREVHVWYLCLEKLNDHSQLRMCKELVAPAEKKYADSINEAKLKKHVILSRALLRTTLSRCIKMVNETISHLTCNMEVWHAAPCLSLLDSDCKIDARSFEFNYNKFGKPEAVTVKSEKEMTNFLFLSLARRFFTPSKADYLADISDLGAQRKEFFKLWTLKEAYVKALGLGISGAPFNEFSVMLEASKGIRISKASKVCNNHKSGCDHLSENWQFALVELNSSHYMAVCKEDDSRSQGQENNAVPVDLKVWKTLPFVQDTLLSGTEPVKIIA